MRSNDLTGQKYGMLTVIGKAECSGISKWNCRCNCGNEVTVFGTNLLNGKTSSCGCSRRKHGDARTRLYNLHQQYIRRGISDEWKDYTVFKDWVIDNGYVEYESTISRIDVHQPYSAENCRVIKKTTNSLQTD